MRPEQSQELIRLLEQGEDISPEWAHILFPPEKREYELVYYGKEREEDILADTLAVPLQITRTFGKNGRQWSNMLIFGDNLQVTKSLLELKGAGKLCNADGTPGVRLIFIDPPFATRKDFKGTQDQKAYQDRIAGAQYLEFLRRRLILMRELLADDGSILIHLDLRKCHYIKTLMDEVFSEARLLNEIIWHYENKLGTGGDKLDGRHDTLFWYSRGVAHVFSEMYEPVKVRKPQPVTQKIDGKRVWLRDEAGKRRYQQSRETRPVGDVWNIPIINPVATERLGYPTQKPEALAERAIHMASKPGDLILDAFAGSGTTCAVAEKLNRRWIGIDCGKLAIYTMQKRMLNLRREIGNRGPELQPKPFTLYNAGLYDFSKLKELPWESWRFFALQLFQCRDERHKIGGIQLDGFLRGASVLVFNHQKQPGVRIDEETIRSVHEALGTKIGSRLFIVAPALTFDFQQDYIDLDDVRYYALRIPYSIIHELHRREFTALRQPSDELSVNDTVDAVGFDFIRTPELEYVCGIDRRKRESPEAFIRITTFKSDAVVREPMRRRGNRETLSMVMLDYNYDGDVFDLDAVLFADSIKKARWEVRFPLNPLGSNMMAVFVDIYGNEARELINRKRFGRMKDRAVARPAEAPAKETDKP
jgi:DNA modification methylase